MDHPYAAALLCTPIIYVFAVGLYNLYFHPLASYPGPFLARASRLWFIRSMIRGTIPFDVQEAHQAYGDVVRIAPNELAYVNPAAWKEIYGYVGGKREIPKDPHFYNNTTSGSLSIIAAPGKRHGEVRRLLSHGFSERALRDQEPVILEYADLLITNLRKMSDEGSTPVDMVKWFNFFTFDVIGDLAFGESFNCLGSSSLHPWVAAIFENVKMYNFIRAASYFPAIKKLVRYFLPKKMIEQSKESAAITKEKALRRLHTDTGRIDFMARMTLPNSGISEAEFIATSTTLIIAGSETTATLLSGVIFYLLKNPDTLAKLVQEVRAAFDSDKEITLSRANDLHYMLACLNEALRIYPPAPGSLPRKTATGEIICGKAVPAETTVSVYQFAMYHSQRNFTQPDKFIPERWLEGTHFDDDNRSALQPFHVGPRNCIGRNLAYIEMRLVLAKLLYHFDIEWTDGCEGWENQKVYFFWEKGPLPVILRQRHDAKH